MKTSEEWCREFGVRSATYDAWKKKDGDSSPDAAKRLRQLERENACLWQMALQQR